MIGKRSKALFSQFGQSVCGDKNTACGKECLNDKSGSVISAVEALIIEKPGYGVLDDVADFA